MGGATGERSRFPDREGQRANEKKREGLDVCCGYLLLDSEEGVLTSASDGGHRTVASAWKIQDMHLSNAADSLAMSTRLCVSRVEHAGVQVFTPSLAIVQAISNVRLKRVSMFGKTRCLQIHENKLGGTDSSSHIDAF